MKQLFSYSLCILILVGCRGDDTRVMDEIQVDDSFAKKVLFIGNSQTTYNEGLANHVRRFADSYQLEIFTAASTQSGFTLQNHLNSPDTIEAIESEEWDFIILQENSYRAAFEPEEMLTAVEGFSELFLTSTAKVYFFQTWAYRDMPEMHPLIRESYTMASTISGFPVVRIGDKWNAFALEYPDIMIHDGDDGVHPSYMGTYLTSAFFFKKLFNYQNLSSNYYGALSNEEALLIQEFVSENSI